MARRCPTCHASYPDDVVWCPVDSAATQDAPPGSVTMGWNLDDASASATMQTSPAHAPPGPVTLGWDIPEPPRTTLAGVQLPARTPSVEAPHAPSPVAMPAIAAGASTSPGFAAASPDT